MLLLLLFGLFSLAVCRYQEAPYADWAHSHLVWIDASDQNEQRIYEMVEGYKSRGIPVGAVNIDSMWSECMNTFTVNRKKFPHMEQLVKDLHAQGIRVILWATPLINQECPQYKQGKDKKYFLNNGKIVKWWHGRGAFIDFFNPAAKQWFKRLMDRVLDMGFDGWKCDGADPIILLLRPWPYSPGLKRYITYRQYANQYYGTFYNYTKSKNPEALIMARPVDSYKGVLYSNYAPKYVMFMGWVGDQHNDVDGFKYAMENIIHSASQNYLNFGFDIGGYKTHGDSKKYLFLRWVQVGSLLPFMENGGNGKHQPWLFDDETVSIYRKFVLLHYELKDFFLTEATEAYKKGLSVLKPIVKDKKTIELYNNKNLGYILGNTYLVQPIFQESGFVQIIFPKGSQWVYFFNHSRVFQGGTTSNLGIKLDETALFIKSNSITTYAGQLWLVYLQQGIQTKSIIHGNHSDEVTVELKDLTLKIKVERYFKTEALRSQMMQNRKLTVKVIGDSSVNLESGRYIRSNIYEQSCQFQIQFGQEVVIEGVEFPLAGGQGSS